MAGGAPVLAARLRKRDSVHGNGGSALPLPFCLRHSKDVHMISLEVRTDGLPRIVRGCRVESTPPVASPQLAEDDGNIAAHEAPPSLRAARPMPAPSHGLDQLFRAA